MQYMKKQRYTGGAPLAYLNIKVRLRRKMKEIADLKEEHR